MTGEDERERGRKIILCLTIIKPMDTRASWMFPSL